MATALLLDMAYLRGRKVLSGVGVEQRVDSLERELNEKHRATESSIKSDLSSIGQKLTELMGEVCQEGRVAIP